MAGFNAPYIPGWDCHGLPIEHNVDKELGDKKKSIPILSKRKACRSYAEKWIKTQKAEFKRLGVIGDWEQPYLTMAYDYEATIAREFNRFLLSGSVIRSKKPVYWCSTCTHCPCRSGGGIPSAQLRLHLRQIQGQQRSLRYRPEAAGDNLHVVIWTTTPWTLPANLAVAFHPDFLYASVAVGEERLLMARDLVEQVMQECAISDYHIECTFSATQLENRTCRHPFMERDSLMVLADYVTLEAGTGCVHTAPGHGADDYHTGLRYGLDILSPVDDEGRYTQEAGPYAGQQIPQVNRSINEDLATAGRLLHQGRISHSYPHCWRCKKPVMYRATPQWFISMEKNDLRQKALENIGRVQWTPGWGMQRIYSMIENRPDWCLSRQRAWGVPITVISCRDCGEIVKDDDVLQRIDALFSKEGADAWFSHELTDFLPAGSTCSSCGSAAFVKESDILDVWFDSGVSYAAVCEQRPELDSPADLYLEGSDQHRGWFHSALLISVGTRGMAPYKGVLTHGYVVDGQGKKMSKSVGNVVAPQEVIEKYGAEILRLWVASEDYRDDVKVSDEILRQISDSYRKIRNTMRYMLGNLYDFDPDRNSVPADQMSELDRWVLAVYAGLTRKVTAAYLRYEFHAVFHSLHNFCVTTMSSLYLDILKDRLYASGPDDPERRAAQTVIYRVLDGLLRLMAPVLTFTTVEAWEHLHGDGSELPVEKSILFVDFPKVDDIKVDDDSLAVWKKLLDIRAEITRVLEGARRDKIIGLSLDAEVLVEAGGDTLSFLAERWDLLREICIVSNLLPVESIADEVTSRVVTAEEVANLKIAVRPAPGSKCERCWTVAESVGSDGEHPAICGRCARVVRSLSA